MIAQGADGLSHGVWVVPERLWALPAEETARVFRTLPWSLPLREWLHVQAEFLSGRAILRPWMHLPFTAPWSVVNVLFWLPPSDVGRQAITAALGLWCEAPYETEYLFLLPCVFQQEWQSISRHVLYLGAFLPEQLPLPDDFIGKIPYILLHLAPFVASLRPTPSTNYGPARPQGGYSWQRCQADQVHWL